MSISFSRQKINTKAPQVPSISKSANSSPRNIKSYSISTSDIIPSFNSHSSNKTICNSLLKHLDDLGLDLDIIIKRFRNYDKDLYQLVLKCEKSLKLTKRKALELSSEDDCKFIDSNALQENSPAVKAETNEYCTFLEYLIAYEQKKTEIIIEKTNFPKVRNKEVEKALADEFKMKSPGYTKLAKPIDLTFADKATKEMNELFAKVHKNLLIHAKIPNELLSEFDKSLNEVEILVDSTSDFRSLDSISAIQDSVKLFKEREKISELFDTLSKDHKKLSVKYSYLINKLTKQDTTIKIQSKKLTNISKSTIALKDQFLQLIEEMKFYMALIHENIMKDIFPKGSVLIKNQKYEELLHEKCLLAKELEVEEKKVQDLEGKLKEANEKLAKINSDEEDEDDSLDLRTNINDMIEIQKLKDQVRLLNFKMAEATSGHQKEVEALKSQISRAKADRFSVDERIRALNMKISELTSEKENLIEEVSKMKLAPQPFEPLRLSGQRLSIENLMNEASNKSDMKNVNTTDVFAMLNDEVEEIAAILKVNNIFAEEMNTNLGLLRKSAELLVELKKELSEDCTDIAIVLIEAARKYNKEEIKGNEAVHTDPDMYCAEKQLEIYKTKLNDKKNQLSLHKQQIQLLKKSVKELQSEVSKANNLDSECLKGMFGNIIKDIPSLPSNTEQMILVLMKILGFTPNEVTKITYERRSKKPAGLFKGLFH